MNNDKREILVFGKTETTFESRTGRAHNTLAYCRLFCFLTVMPIFRLFVFYFLNLNIRSHRPVGRLLRNFAS